MSAGGARLVTPAAVAAVLARPRLWGPAMRALVHLAARGWWRRWPPVPAPDPAYLEWRRQTAYGGVRNSSPAEHPDVVHDLVSYLEFCRALRKSAR
ncbi:MAG: hypothetical protein IT198_02475 [Acidimicrobiia bacterium]|nr:hypothetical protein [Acidimicrobiia bacterium]